MLRERSVARAEGPPPTTRIVGIIWESGRPTFMKAATSEARREGGSVHHIRNGGEVGEAVKSRTGGSIARE